MGPVHDDPHHHTDSRTRAHPRPHASLLTHDHVGDWLDRATTDTGGKRKLKAVRGALNGRWINVLVIDVGLAQALLDSLAQPRAAAKATATGFAVVDAADTNAVVTTAEAVDHGGGDCSSASRGKAVLRRTDSAGTRVRRDMDLLS